MTCRICRSEQREQIDRALIEQRPLRSIAAQYGTSATALLRHRQRDIPATLSLGKQAHDVEHGESLLVQIRRLSAETLEILAAAKRDKDRDTQLKAIAQALKNLELEGKLLGELGRAKTPPSKQSHLHIHGNDAVRAFVLASGRLPSSDEMVRLTGQQGAISDGESVRKPDDCK